MENIQDNQIHLYRVRPRFNVLVKDSLENVTDKIKEGFENHPSRCYGKVSHDFVVIQLPKEMQHYWSPQLSIMIEQEGENNLLEGLYGPRPNVWTMFVFFYFIIGLAIVIALVIGFSNISLGESGVILWTVPFLVLTFCSLYLVAYLGQRLSRDQMQILHDFIEDSLNIEIREN
jgi:hypothetical protein